MVKINLPQKRVKVNYVVDGKKVRATQDVITVEGYEPYTVPFRMYSQSERECNIDWVLKLIQEGKIKKVYQQGVPQKHVSSLTTKEIKDTLQKLEEERRREP